MHAQRGRNGGNSLLVEPARLRIGVVLREHEGDPELVNCEALSCRLSADCLLRDALRGFKAAKKDIYLTGDARVLQLVRDAAKAGDKSVDVAMWLLLLDLYQMLGMQNEFEEAAVDYAVTYEVSPPSWETPPPRPKPLEVSQPIAVAAE